MTPIRCAAILVLLLGAALQGSAASERAPSSVTVMTSRGEFKLLVYAPAPPQAAVSAAAEGDPPQPSASGPGEKPLILLASGEGGWRGFDGMISGFFRDAGYWVGGIDAMKYFWTPQDDRQALASDIRAYAGALAAAAGKRSDAPLVLAGFSFGADIAPWVAGAGGWGDRIHGLILIGPDATGSLEFRILEILGFDPKDHIFSVAEALASAAGVPVLLLHGEKDSGCAAPALVTGAAEPKKMVVVPGANHHYSGKEEALRRALIEGMDWIRTQKRPAPAGVQSDP